MRHLNFPVWRIPSSESKRSEESGHETSRSTSTHRVLRGAPANIFCFADFASFFFILLRQVHHMLGFLNTAIPTFRTVRVELSPSNRNFTNIANLEPGVIFSGMVAKLSKGYL